MAKITEIYKKNEIITRKTYLDIAKGILIILVVIGHSKIDKTFPIVRNIYWFHMPAFFIISGYLFKLHKNDFIPWIKRKVKNFFIPYTTYGLIILIVLYHKDLLVFTKQLVKYIYSGRAIDGVYWFIPCLFLTQIIFGLLIAKFKKKYVIIALLIMYILAHIEAAFYIPKDNNYLHWSYIYDAPWNIDVCLMSIPYFAIGFYFKKIIDAIDKKFKIYVFIMATLICIVLIGLSYYNIFNYSLDMKLSHYNHLVLDIIIPVLFTTWVIMFGKLISKVIMLNRISFVGLYTLPIMYLHLPINNVLQSRLNYGNLVFIIVGVILPLTFAWICSKNKYLDYYFLKPNRR